MTRGCARHKRSQIPSASRSFSGSSLAPRLPTVGRSTRARPGRGGVVLFCPLSKAAEDLFAKYFARHATPALRARGSGAYRLAFDVEINLHI